MDGLLRFPLQTCIKNICDILVMNQVNPYWKPYGLKPKLVEIN